MKRFFLPSNLHLTLSAGIVIPMGGLYGLRPDFFWLSLMELPITHPDLKNIFAAIMGLYLGFAVWWVAGIVQQRYWYAASLSNIVFMAGLGFGRMVSWLMDGRASVFYTIGGVLELLMAVLGMLLLRRYGKMHQPDKQG
jgi:Domain of unknown function (DUF4345)